MLEDKLYLIQFSILASLEGERVEFDESSQDDKLPLRFRHLLSN